MTVRNANYSSLDEVWGDAMAKQETSKSSKRKERKDKREKTEPPKVVDPICELYEMGNYRGYNENDIINYANEYHDKYIEQEYRKDNKYATQGYTQGYNNPYARQHDDEDVYYANDEIHSQRGDTLQDTQNTQNKKHDIKASASEPSTYHKRSKDTRHFEEDDDYIKDRNEFAFIDLLLYIISGIILIFVMEQFVKIGLLLQ
jgi:hypothetical protein